MTHQDLIKQYGLDKELLLTLYDRIVEFLNEKGVKITYINLEPIVESDIYKIDRQIKAEDKHHESCLSDGMEVYLHHDMEDIGGICGRLYDILHVGCGHLWQWSANRGSNLKFKGDQAWTIGSAYYLGANDEDLRVVWDYEEEAGILAFANLKLILNKYKFDEEFSKKVSQFFNDYLKTDLEYITSFYRTGQVKNFFEKWQLNSTELPKISLDFTLNIMRRSNKCIALLNLRS